MSARDTASAATEDEAYLRYRRDIEEMNDLFSASWLMCLDRFLGLEAGDINIVEDGCFQAFKQYPDHTHMTRDWLEFAVEHMSKWWKVINIFRHPNTLVEFLATLDAFGHEPVDDVPDDLANTIAIVAFMPYRDDADGSRGEAFTVAMLTACIRSLSRYRVGRVVVVVPSAADRDLYGRLVPERFGETTVAFRTVGPARTRFIETNMPYGAIAGLQQAFESDEDDWLGGETRWSAVYLTEPDTLLHLKPALLPDLMEGVRQGRILTPHRLQPIPHASDLADPLGGVTVVPDNELHPVQDIDSYEVRLIDSGNDRPKFEPCGNFWYLCGFANGDHSRIEPYELIRLSHGLGITMLMGSEHGRQCHIG